MQAPPLRQCGVLLRGLNFINTMSEQNTVFLNVKTGCRERQRERDAVRFI